MINESRNFTLMEHHYPDLGTASDGQSKFPTRHDQSEVLPRSGKCRNISMEFFPLFLRHHFEGETSGGKMLAVFSGQPIQSNPA